MISGQRRWMARLATVLPLALIVAGCSSARGESLLLSPSYFDKFLCLTVVIDPIIPFIPLVRPIDPLTARRMSESLPHALRPAVRERVATLANPATGRELIEQVLSTTESRPTVEMAASRAATPRRVFFHQRPAPTYLLPVPVGV
jgi:hypothetical protein